MQHLLSPTFFRSESVRLEMCSTFDQVSLDFLRLNSCCSLVAILDKASGSFGDCCCLMVSVFVLDWERLDDSNILRTSSVLYREHLQLSWYLIFPLNFFPPDGRWSVQPIQLLLRYVHNKSSSEIPLKLVSNDNNYHVDSKKMVAQWHVLEPLDCYQWLHSSQLNQWNEQMEFWKIESKISWPTLYQNHNS